MTAIWSDRFAGLIKLSDNRGSKLNLNSGSGPLKFAKKNSPPQSPSLSFKERGKPKAGVSSLQERKSESIEIRVNPADLQPAIGYYGKNRKLLEKHFRIVKFVTDPEIKEKTFHVDYR
jgi:hypothetical protein